MLEKAVGYYQDKLLGRLMDIPLQMWLTDEDLLNELSDVTDVIRTLKKLSDRDGLLATIAEIPGDYVTDPTEWSDLDVAITFATVSYQIILTSIQVGEDPSDTHELMLEVLRSMYALCIVEHDRLEWDV